MSELHFKYKEWITEDGHIPLYAVLNTVEKQILETAYFAAGFKIWRAAEILKINRTTMSKKLRKFNIIVDGPREADNVEPKGKV